MPTKASKIQILCESAVMIALAFALSYIKLFDGPFGGAVTPASMLPLCLIAIKYGTKWGLASGFCYSWLQVLQSAVFGWGLTPGVLIGCLLLDYVLAFTVLGLAGIFRKFGFWGKFLGILSATLLRFLCHFLSGIILWTNLESFTAFGSTFAESPVLYSLVYNGGFMLPESIILLAAASVLYNIPQAKKYL